MSEHPLRFQGAPASAMVRAVLHGAKTQVRLPIGLATLRRSRTPGYDWTFRGIGGVRTVAHHLRHPLGCWQDLREVEFLKLCPFGAPGDDLWVRETWACLDAKVRPGCRLAYRADTLEGERVRVDAPWRPSTAMPRWASRLLLRVTAVRVERLHAITEEDARAQGVLTLEPRTGATTARERFADLWSEVYGLASWEEAPWVWAATFERIEGAK